MLHDTIRNSPKGLIVPENNYTGLGNFGFMHLPGARLTLLMAASLPLPGLAAPRLPATPCLVACQVMVCLPLHFPPTAVPPAVHTSHLSAHGTQHLPLCLAAHCTQHDPSCVAVLFKATAAVRLDDFVLAHSPYAMPVVRYLESFISWPLMMCALSSCFCTPSGGAPTTKVPLCQLLQQAGHDLHHAHPCGPQGRLLPVQAEQQSSRPAGPERPESCLPGQPHRMGEWQEAGGLSGWVNAQRPHVSGMLMWCSVHRSQLLLRAKSLHRPLSMLSQGLRTVCMLLSL